MQKAAGFFEAAASDATGQLNHVDQQMTALQAFWHGQASYGYIQAMEAWETEFDKIIQELVKMIGIMGHNIQKYKQGEESAIDHSSSWLGGLPNI